MPVSFLFFVFSFFFEFGPGEGVEEEEDDISLDADERICGENVGVEDVKKRKTRKERQMEVQDGGLTSSSNSVVYLYRIYSIYQ